MTQQRAIIEMGMGNDLHGGDVTKAALRAVDDALRHSTLTLFRNADIALSDMKVKVTIGVQDPASVDRHAIGAAWPFGTPEVVVVRGGLNVDTPGSGDPIIVASAAVEVFLPLQASRWKATPIVGA